jgi:hypothetical protein
MNRIVKFVPLAFLFLLVCTVARAQDGFPKPHMLYFYNPTCRLCTKTNEVVGATETKYKERMSFQRFNIADPKEGTNNVLYMFDLMDEMKVPEEDETTLVVFVGLLEKEGEEIFFTPKRVLVEGEAIIENIDKTVQEFLDAGAKGGVSVGPALPTSFFLAHRVGCRAAS